MAVAHLLDSFAADLAHGALSRTAEFARGRRNSGARTPGHHRIGRSVSGRLESDRSLAARCASRWSVFIIRIFRKRICAAAPKFLGKTRRAARDEAFPGLRAQALQSVRGDLVPSERLAQRPARLGRAQRPGRQLGVNTDIFQSRTNARSDTTRRRLGIEPERKLAALRRPTRAGKEYRSICFDAFEILQQRRPNEFHLLVIGDGPQRTQLRQAASANIETCPGSSIAPIRANWPATIARRICSFIRACRKHLDWSRWKVRLAARRSSAFAAAHGPDLFFTTRKLGATRTAPEALADAIERVRATEIVNALGRNAARAGGGVCIPGRRCSSDCFAFTARSAQTTANFKSTNDDHKPFTIRSYRRSDREAVRQLCCQTGFLGEPIDPVYEDRELFADFLTTYYTDQEPESSFVLEIDGEIRGYLLGSRKPLRNQLYSFWQNVSLFFRALTRYSRYNERSRRFILWILVNGWREVPAAPRRTPHFHINLLPDARKMSTTRALMSAYLSYLYRCGEKRVYGQIVTFESRRGEKMFERYGFKVLNRPRSRNTRRSIPNRFISAP